MSNDNKIEVCITPTFLSFDGDLECFIDDHTVRDYCRGKGKENKCAYVNRKAQGGNAFFSECAGKNLHSSVEKGAIFMWAITVSNSLAW